MTTRSRIGARVMDDTGSMAMYLMFAIMGMALGALMVPMIITQAHTTRSDTSRVHALDAAQAGLSVMVGEVRAAALAGVGTSALLPCDATSGVVNGTGSATYTVTVTYYMADPVASPQATPMRCVEPHGPYDPVTDSFTPKYARIIAVGRDGPAVKGATVGRTLATTYGFRTSDTNIPGGRIRIFPASSSSPELCLDAGSTTPSAGELVKLQVCATPALAQQVFAYRSDLTLQLLSSITATYPDGLCLDTAPPPVAGRAISLGECSELGSPTYIQQWSFNDNGGYTASMPNSARNGVLSSQCIFVATQSPGTQVTLAPCKDGFTRSPTQAWIPSPAVGAGAAEAPQLINYYEFGRCLDVTNQDVNSNHLIDFPCKQNPSPGEVTWNQKFTTPGIAEGDASATGRIYTTRGGRDYCLTSPGTDGGYVTVQTCSGSNARQTWTVYGGSSTLAYSTKYTIVDNTARCLGLTEPVTGELWSAIDVDVCTGATQQKWNALTNLASSVVQDIDELPTAG